ncbi:hypothetical protein O5O45_26625 [Hahella aquimaris]|uniref:hypothetical protein n=1 Tax=Hahella sp. HNIBRBA332 TaxID=3015983 RepID=UPI00273BAA9A|nr:hypothetical protein [Hahella sp. HNIBRBA332]WLQ13302.1 hypothetical protein O5O45_26625 [Hahella sp. HNIBRBA332]
MNYENLDKFGQILITQVRDVVIDRFVQKFAGGYKDQESQINAVVYQSLDENTQKFVSKIVKEVIDSTLHELLFMVEQNEEIEVVVKNGGEVTNIKENIDGLCGELYTEDGWIEKYSKHDPSRKIVL